MEVILRKIKVDGYKNLIGCEVEMGDLNILVGPNNSGKSNFLEIFTFVDVLLNESDTTRRKVFESASTPRGDSAITHIEGHEGQPMSFSFLFDTTQDDFTAEVEYSVKISAKDYMNKVKNIEVEYLGFVSEELKYKERNKPGKPSILVKRDHANLQLRSAKGNMISHNIDVLSPAFNTAKVLIADTTSYDKAIAKSIAAVNELLSVKILSASPNEIRDAIGKSALTPFGVTYKTTSFDLLPVIEEISSDELLFAEFNNMVCATLDVESIKFFSFPFPNEFKTKDSPDDIKWCTLKPHGQPLSYIANFSDGTLMVIALLAVIFSPSRPSKIISIEEPENCLHPKALRTLMTFLKAKSSELQLIITTHSPSLLNQVDPSDVIVVRVHEDGGTRLERIDNLRELNKVLRRGYITFGDLLETEFTEEKEEIF